MITSDRELCPLEVQPQERDCPDDAERLIRDGEAVHSLRKKSAAIEADGVIISMGLLFL